MIAHVLQVRVRPRTRIWDWEIPTAEQMRADTRSDAEIVDEFREALRDAVRQRLVADVEVASYLSGGIDSCAVLGLAQQEMERPIRAFTLTFENPLYDEAGIAEAQARHVGATYHPIPITGDPVAIILAIMGVLVIVGLVLGVVVLVRGDNNAPDDPASAENQRLRDEGRAEKQRLRDVKAAERHRQRQSEQEARAAQLAEGRKRAGSRVHSGNFGGKTVEVYSNGYVRVALFMRDSVPFQKLLSIEYSGDIQKKTGIGRAGTAVLTGGANLLLTPNKRGDVYLNVVTEGEVYAPSCIATNDLQHQCSRGYCRGGGRGVEASRYTS